LRVSQGDIPTMDPTIALSLKWPRWYPASAADRQLDATTLVTLMNSGLISRSSAIKAIADTYDIDDIAAELAQCVVNPERGQ